MPTSSARFNFPPKVKLFIWWLVPLLVIVSAFVLSARNTSNVPKWDDFPIIGDPLLKSLEGELTFSDWMRQEVDNRMPFPKLIYVGLARISHWRIEVTTAASVLLGATGVILCGLLGRKTFPQGSIRSWLLAALSAVFVFSMSGWMIWVYSTFLSYPLVFLCLAAKLYLFQTQVVPGWKIGLGCALSVVASYSFLNGWLNWMALGWLMLGMRLRKEISLKGLGVAFVASLAAFGISLAFYFNGYELRSQPGLIGRLMADPMKYVDFYLRWLGSPFGHPWPDLPKPDRVAAQFIVAKWAGIAMVSLLFAAGYAFWKGPQKRLQAWPWCALGLWGLASGGLVTMGRADLSAEAFSWCRYQLFVGAVYLACAALILIYLPIIRARLALLGLVPVVFIGIGGFNGFVTGYRSLRSDFFGSQQVHAGMIMMDAAPEPLFLNNLPGDYAGMEKIARPLTLHGYIRPGFLGSDKVSAANVQNASRFSGVLIEGKHTSSTDVTLRGYAVDQLRKCPVDAIVISYQADGGEETWWAISQDRKPAHKMAAKLKLSPANSRIGWELEPPADLPTPPRKRLPDGKWTLRAYVLDVENLVFHRLEGSYRNTLEPPDFN